MKVRCISTYPNEEQMMKIGLYPGQSFGVTIGKEYLVVGLSFQLNSGIFGTGLCVNVVDDGNYFVTIPLCLFEVLDARASRHWRIHTWEDGNITLWPESFYAPYYVDDHNEDFPEVRADFKKVYSQLEAEAAEPSSPPLRLPLH